MCAQAIHVPGVPTVQNPDPPPEFITTFPMLCKHFQMDKARMLMAAMGDDWEDPNVDEEETPMGTPIAI